MKKLLVIVLFGGVVAFLISLFKKKNLPNICSLMDSQFYSLNTICADIEGDEYGD